MISQIVAASTNNAIGKNNQLLWHLPNDLKFFKNLTWGGVVIMGRKTYESIGRPLPGRMNIVITSNPQWSSTGVIVAHSLNDAIEKASLAHYKEIYIIGGGEIYRQSMPMTDIIYLTRVLVEIDGDTFFPDLNPDEWQLVSSRDCQADDKNLYPHRFEEWRKR
jgi:dihydrofolate reductase